MCYSTYIKIMVKSRGRWIQIYFGTNDISLSTRKILIIKALKFNLVSLIFRWQDHNSTKFWLIISLKLKLQICQNRNFTYNSYCILTILLYIHYHVLHGKGENILLVFPFRTCLCIVQNRRERSLRNTLQFWGNFLLVSFTQKWKNNKKKNSVPTGWQVKTFIILDRARQDKHFAKCLKWLYRLKMCDF